MTFALFLFIYVPFPSCSWDFAQLQVKVKVLVYSPDIYDYVCVFNFAFLPGGWAPLQPATIDPTLDLCSRYLLRLGGPRQCGI